MKKILFSLVLLALAAAFYGAYLFGRQTGPSGFPAPGEGTAMRVVLPQTREVDLYFADSDGRRLSIERREVTGENLEDLFGRVIEELLRGPSEGTRLRTLPEAARVRTIFFREGTAWVDLDGAARDEHPGGTWTEVLAVYSIVNTLVENFTEVERVQILIDGSESDTLAGHVDISVPLESRIQLLAGEWE